VKQIKSPLISFTTGFIYLPQNCKLSHSKKTGTVKTL
jgi:hypothetical protein